MMPDIMHSHNAESVLSHSFDQRRRPHGDSDGLLLPNQHDKPLAAGDAGLEQITLQHGVVLCHDRNHHGRVFRPGSYGCSWRTPAPGCRARQSHT